MDGRSDFTGIKLGCLSLLYQVWFLKLIEILPSIFQAMYGMKGNSSYKKQYEKTLENSFTRGELSITEYHLRKQSMKTRDLAGTDDGHSCTKGVDLKGWSIDQFIYITENLTFLCPTGNLLDVSLNLKSHPVLVNGFKSEIILMNMHSSVILKH